MIVNLDSDSFREYIFNQKVLLKFTAVNIQLRSWLLLLTWSLKGELSCNYYHLKKCLNVLERTVSQPGIYAWCWVSGHTLVRCEHMPLSLIHRPAIMDRVLERTWFEIDEVEASKLSINTLTSFAQSITIFDQRFDCHSNYLKGFFNLVSTASLQWLKVSTSKHLPTFK